MTICHTHGMSNVSGAEASTGQITVQAQWILNPSDLPATANQILIQPSAPLASGKTDGAYVTVGHLNPPMVDGTPGPINPEMAADMVFPVVPVARFLVSRERLADFRDALTAFIDTMDAAEG